MIARQLAVGAVSLVLAAWATAVPPGSATAAENGKPPVLTVLERTARPLLKADRPWESMGISPNAVLRIGNQWRLWYAAFDHSYRSDNDCYLRMWSGGDFQGARIVGYTMSATFGGFPDPVEILRTDKDDPGDMQFYNSATTKLNERLYLMFPSGLRTSDQTVSVYAAYSRDGKRFSRLGRAPLLGLGQEFDNKGIYVCPGAIPAEEPNAYWVYYGGTGVRHDATPGSHHYNGGLGRFLLKVVD